MSSTIQVASLLPLQDLDLKIHRLRRSLDATPGELAAGERRLAEKEAELEAAAEKVKGLKLDASREEQKIQTIDELIAKFEGQVRLVKKNDEYQILMKEISSKKADKSVIEDALMEIWTVVEHEEGLKKQRARELAEQQQQHEEVRRRIKEEQARTRSELEQLETRRADLRASLDLELVELYERTQTAKQDGRGLAPMVAVETGGKGADSFVCGGCNVNITLQDANLVFVGRQTTICRNCARLFYVPTSS